MHNTLYIYEIKIHILRQVKENLNIKIFLCPLASSLPCAVHCISALCIDETSPPAEIPEILYAQL